MKARRFNSEILKNAMTAKKRKIRIPKNIPTALLL
jgi:hypothetical protein